MSKHLPILRDMFPGELMLGVDHLAKCLNLSRGHIYNLSSARRLPFKIDASIEGRVRVSIVELADYLDRSLLTQPSVNDGALATVASPVKRGPGRPRGSTNERLTRAAFQAMLRAEIFAFESRTMLLEMSGRLMTDAQQRLGHDQVPNDLPHIVLAAEVQVALTRLEDIYLLTEPEPEPEPEAGTGEVGEAKR